METAADAILRGAWTPQDLPFSALPARFGYQLQPQDMEDGFGAFTPDRTRPHRPWMRQT